MTNFEIDNVLKTIVVTIDTREQNTDLFSKRQQDIGCCERKTLPYGDYSCKFTLPNGKLLDFSKQVVIERKMNADELCLCFGKERRRFKAEFDRAKADKCRVYLLVENCTWEHIILGKYRSKYNSEALLASIFAWIPRYNMIPVMCKAELSGKLIKEILYREVKEYLQKEGEGDWSNITISSGG